jgi:hypothetical protein
MNAQAEQMKEFVYELSALVGGTAAKKESKFRPDTRMVRANPIRTQGNKLLPVTPRNAKTSGNTAQKQSDAGAKKKATPKQIAPVKDEDIEFF